LLPRRTRTRRRSAVALLAAAALAGCGGGHARHATPPPAPKLPRALADRLAARSDDVARKLDAGDSCGALTAARDLQQQTIGAINARQVPAALQEPLLGAANALVVRITCTPPPPGEQDHRQQMQGEGEQHHGKAKGHHKHHGDEGGD
jgi:hypothetical protein